MRRQWILALAVVCLLGATDKKDAKCDATPDAVKEEKARLKGTWQLISLIYPDGTEITGKVAETSSFVFIEDKIIICPDKDGKGGKEVGYTLDPTKKRRRMDLIGIEDEDKGRISPGIYELDGDTLKLCLTGPDRCRPTEIKADKDKGTGILTFKRVKK